MPAKIDKVIVTNVGALGAKYHPAGLAAIQGAVQDLQTADQVRGLVTQYIPLDDAAAMTALGGSAVTSLDPRQNKAAIDAVYKALSPDYVLILGSVDIVPHQDMLNPLFDPTLEHDTDKFAYGDLPYACEARYSQNPADFNGPTRVVGRLPDITGAGDPAYLTGLIARAARSQPRDRAAFTAYFAVSAAIFEDSSALSISKIFGSQRNLQPVPPMGPPWADTQLGRRMHFYNCHGAPGRAKFYGQPAKSDQPLPPGQDPFPVALNGPDLAGRISEGTVVATEACYGGQLYAPDALEPEPPICNRYLQNGAAGVFASTTTAYGPFNGNGQADIITQIFLRKVLDGASLGRAALEARQEFVASATHPADTKTLAQFNLYGDPSVTPVKLPLAGTPPLGGADQETADRIDRSDRRLSLYFQGDHLVRTQLRVVKSEQEASPEVLAGMDAHARSLGLEASSTLRFEAEYPDLTGLPQGLRDIAAPTAFVVTFASPKTSPEAPVAPITLLISREVEGRLVPVDHLASR
jgi:Peptidase family C25